MSKVIKNCLFCHKEFTVIYKFRKRKFCSLACNYSRRIGVKRTPMTQEQKDKISKSKRVYPEIEKICLTCKCIFITSSLLNDRKKYCSRDCFTEDKKFRFSGENNPFYGEKHKQETKDVLSVKMKGKPSPMKGVIRDDIRGDNNPSRRPEVQAKISLMKSRERSNWWRGGISNNPYPGQWGKTLRRNIRERDEYICRMCKEFGKDVHHIDYDKNNCAEINLITLCHRCHMKTNHKREYWIEYFRKLRNK